MSYSKLLLLMLIIFFIFSLYLYNENLFLENRLYRYENRISLMNETINEMNKSLSFYKSQNELLEDRIINLSFRLKKKDEAYSKLLDKYNRNLIVIERIENKTSYLDELYENLTSSLEESLDWLKSNSYLSSTKINDEIYKCEDGEKFNYPCFVYLLEDEDKLTYEYEYNDKLKSIDEILKTGKGDCEDFSILALSVLNKLKDRGIKKLILFKESPGYDFDLYSKDGYSYYLPDSKKIYRDLNNLAVVCYNLEDDGMEGHCIVSVYSNSIEDGYFFEPQTGEFLEEDFYLCKEGDECNKKNEIFLYFNGEDMHLFSDGKWLSYKMIEEQLISLKKEFENLRKEASSTLNN